MSILTSAIVENIFPTSVIAYSSDTTEGYSELEAFQSGSLLNESGLTSVLRAILPTVYIISADQTHYDGTTGVYSYTFELVINGHYVKFSTGLRWGEPLCVAALFDGQQRLWPCTVSNTSPATITPLTSSVTSDYEDGRFCAVVVSNDLTEFENASVPEGYVLVYKQVMDSQQKLTSNQFSNVIIDGNTN